MRSERKPGKKRSVNAVHKSRADKVAEERLSSPKTRLWFGKYSGKTVEQVAEIDIGYLRWLSIQRHSVWRMTLLSSFLREYCNE